ncbi:hypothetical protein QJS10_CPB19g00532 [Acorus calamus]|uniref:Uncharacterized protein n=1 Tax=Acorus calamus TaxID=4465 RepID=A0AAV9CIH2_ACOCL|nr:hypothetical protein QJS10_CPB19g00532 [Acorus calamus]
MALPMVDFAREKVEVNVGGCRGRIRLKRQPVDLSYNRWWREESPVVGDENAGHNEFESGK